MNNISIIVAHDLNRGIGKDNQLVWHCPEDMAYFKALTSNTDDSEKQNIVLMGRKTYESIPERYRPLPNRINMVLTSQKNAFFHDDVITVNSIDQALGEYKSLLNQNRVEQFFCIGGAQLYNSMITHQAVKNLYVTLIHQQHDVDCYFPDYIDQFQISSEGELLDSKNLKYQFLTYQKK